MSKRRSYSDEQKQEALRLYVEVGPGEAARQTQIPQKTIQTWAARQGVRSEAVEKTRAARDAKRANFEKLRAELQLRMVEMCHTLLDRVDAEHIDFKTTKDDVHEVTFPHAPAQAVRDYMVSVGILIDKIRLERGEAGDISEVRRVDEARQRVGDVLGVPPEKVGDELAKRRAAAERAA